MVRKFGREQNLNSHFYIQNIKKKPIGPQVTQASGSCWADPIEAGTERSVKNKWAMLARQEARLGRNLADRAMPCRPIYTSNAFLESLQKRL